MTVSREFVDTVQRAANAIQLDPSKTPSFFTNLEASLEDGKARYDAPRVFRLFKSLGQIHGRADIGIVLAQAVPIGSFHRASIAQALVSCANWRQALMISSRYNRLSQSYARIGLVADTPEAVIEWASPYTHAENCREAIDYIMFGNLNFAQWMSWGNNVPIKRVQFRHSDSGYGHLYSQTFDCDVLFNQPVDAVTLATRTIDEPFPKADFDMLRQQCAKLDEELRALDDAKGIIGKIDALLRNGGAAGVPGITDIAEELGQSERQLRRSLKDEGYTFRQILSITRRNLCEELLIEGELPLSEIAERLGYSEQSAFNRAFKNWFGATPKTYARAINIFNTAFDQLAP